MSTPKSVMKDGAIAEKDLIFKPVGRERWNDLKELFGKHGAYGGCWCMWWRMARSEFDRRSGAGKKVLLKRLIDSGTVPGIIAYLHEKPVGWCSIAPREQFPVLNRSPVLKKVDEATVWSIVCFFIARPFRGKGLNRLMIKGALAYAKHQGATIVEAYPVDKTHSKNTSLDGFTGFATTFLSMGFKEIIRRSEKRPILRYYFR